MSYLALPGAPQVYEIVAAQRPFAGVDLTVLPGIVREGRRPAVPVLQEERLAAAPAGAALLALMAQCWAARPAARPRFRFIEHQLLALCDGVRKAKQPQQPAVAGKAAA